MDKGSTGKIHWRSRSCAVHAIWHISCQTRSKNLRWLKISPFTTARSFDFESYLSHHVTHGAFNVHRNLNERLIFVQNISYEMMKFHEIEAHIEDWLKIHRSFRRCMDQTFITVSVLITNSLMKAWRVSDSELRNTIKAWLWDMFGVPWTGLWECRTDSRLTVRSSTVWLVDMSFRGHQSWRNEPYSVPDESSGMKKNSEGAVADWVARRLTSSKKKWISIFHPCFVDLLEFHIGLAGPVNCVQSKYYYKLT